MKVCECVVCGGLFSHKAGHNLTCGPRCRKRRQYRMQEIRRQKARDIDPPRPYHRKEIHIPYHRAKNRPVFLACKMSPALP
jgi:hypothetical protein